MVQITLKRIFKFSKDFNPLCQAYLMKFPIFGLCASVDIRPLPGAWVAELLGVVLGVQDHKKIKFLMTK